MSLMDLFTRPLLLVTVGTLMFGGGIGVVVYNQSNAPESVPPVPQPTGWIDPVIQAGANHSHGNLSQHLLNTPNIKLIDYHNLNWNEKNVAPTHRITEVYVEGDYAYAAGFNHVYILDISDPTDVKLVGHYEDNRARIIDVKVSEDGNWLLANSELTNTDLDPEPPNDPRKYGFNSIDLIDISDKTRPVLRDTWLNPPAGYHNQWIHKINGEQYLFLSDPYGGLATNGNRPGTQIAKVVIAGGLNATPKIMPWGQYEPNRANTNGGSIFNHDNIVQKHPITGQYLFYGAYWDAGLRIVDVSNPPIASAGNWYPPEIGKWDDFKGSGGNIHHAVPYPGLIDGRHFTVVAPEFSGSDHTGWIMIIDTTKPTDPFEVGRWIIPGNHTNRESGRFTFSPHNLDLGNGHIYLGHYHAGMWVIDMATEEARANPQALGYYLPHGDPELGGSLDSTYGRTPTVWGTQYQDGYIYVADVYSGFYVLQYDGDLENMPL